MMNFFFFLILWIVFSWFDLPVAASPSSNSAQPADVFPNASLEPEDLIEFPKLSKPIQLLITKALALTHQNLTYLYGSADPKEGGMDCSGFIYYLLSQIGLKDVPRSASQIYSWVRKEGLFKAVLSNNQGSFELSELKPGDLLFWIGTYPTANDPPITHVMIYLGHEKQTGEPVMVGSSDGRTYHGKRRWGVSVFDLFMKFANPHYHLNGSTKFIGYGKIPGIETLEEN